MALDGTSWATSLGADPVGIAGAVVAATVAACGVLVNRGPTREASEWQKALAQDTPPAKLATLRSERFALLPDDGPIAPDVVRDQELRLVAGRGSAYTLSLIFAPMALVVGALAALYDTHGISQAVRVLPLAVGTLSGAALVSFITKLRTTQDQVLRQLLEWLKHETEKERLQRTAKRSALETELARARADLDAMRTQRDEAKAEMARYISTNTSPMGHIPDNPMGSSEPVRDRSSQSYSSPKTSPPTSGGHFVDLP